MSHISDPDFHSFLVEAKLATYAALESAHVPPLLPGTKQLEHARGPYMYRDIYVGGLLFVGQEIVYYDDMPIWSMCYSGGMEPDALDIEIGGFLRAALRAAPADAPYRGPLAFEADGMAYHNQPSGTLASFSGLEQIFQGGRLVYTLRYGGGVTL